MLNVRPLKSSSLLVHDDLTVLGIDVLMLTKTRLKELLHSCITECTRSGYFFLHRYRSDKTAGGGVALIVQNLAAASEVLIGRDLFCECALLSDSKVLLIVDIYRPLSASMSQFINDFSVLRAF